MQKNYHDIGLGEKKNIFSQKIVKNGSALRALHRPLEMNKTRDITLLHFLKLSLAPLENTDRCFDISIFRYFERCFTPKLVRI
jgi:hypothetical protein